jgi:hypothetical protein
MTRDRAHERQRVRHANGAGHGVPASERAGGSGGAQPPGVTMSDPISLEVSR